MDVQTRLEANAIIDRLVADGSTFSRDDARRLIDLIPVTPGSRLSFSGIFKGPGSRFRGHAAGLGNVEVDEESKEKRITLNEPASHRIGGYVVTHTPGAITVELMWAETKLDQTGLSCQLVYDARTKEPQELQIAAQKSLSLLFLTFSYISYIPWKQPESGHQGRGR
ncbi:hypothetical protein [Microvirga arsenatis]|uniref:hypothetical protein n=1 Tax=Microvirga arsenatis TaxID=2692265 RepID=UPI00191C142D|nr:hypothetical protein [Microvirga arsenatis]